MHARNPIAAATAILLTATISPAAPPLAEALRPLEPYLGTWQIDAEWADASRLWAHATYTPIVQGKYIESRVFVRDGPESPDNPVYLRYISLFAPGDTPDTITAHTFSHDGTYDTTTLTIDDTTDPPLVNAQWTDNGATVRESQQIPTPHSPDRFRWNVWVSSADAPERPIMDGVWRRTPGAPAPPVPTEPLDPALQRLEQFIGAWEVETHWPDGRALWARTTLKPHPGGNLLFADVLARDGSPEHPDTLGDTYHRYRAFYIPGDTDNTIREITFTYQADTMHGLIDTGADEPDLLAVTYPPDSPHRPLITKTCRFTDHDTMQWIVTARIHASSDDTTRTLVQGTWHKIPEARAMARPIDPTLFDSSGMDTRAFTVSQTIHAPVEDVYKAFADPRAFAAAYAPDRPELEANIDLAIGGRYEWLFDGTLGSNGCQVLSYIPNRMISFSWNAPPSQPESRARHTWVVVETRPDPENPATATNVTLTHLGFGPEPHWTETMDYFRKAWPHVLAQLEQNLER